MEELKKPQKILLSALFIAGIILIAFALSSFQAKSESSKKQELYKAADEILITNSKVLSSTLHSDFQTLNIIAKKILTASQEIEESLTQESIIDIAQEHMDFPVMFVSDQLGNAVYFTKKEEKQGYLYNDSFFGGTYVMDKTVSNTFVYHGAGELDGKTVFMMVVPIMNGSRPIGSVGAILDVEILRPVVYSQFLDGNSYMVMFTDKGDLISRQVSKYNMDSNSSNLLRYLNEINIQAEIEGKVKIDIVKFKQDLGAKKGGTLTFDSPNGTSTIIHQYTGMSEWHMGIVIPQEIIEAEIDRFVALGVSMSILIVIGFMLIIAYVIITNILNHKLHQKQYAQNLKNQGKYKLMSENAQKGMFEYDIKTGELICDQNFTFIVGKDLKTHYKYEEFVDLVDVHPEDQYKMELLGENDINKEMNDSKIKSAILRVQGPDKNYRWHEINLMWIKDEEEYGYIIGSIEEIHDRVESENKLKQYAETDLLSGLYNKITTENKIKEFLKSEDGIDGTHGFIIIDCDNFKLVNDHMGHQEGDKLIAQYSNNLQRILRKDDIKGRIGGDEFAIFIKNATPEIVEQRAQQILDSFDQIYQMEHKYLRVSGTIGICLYPEAATFDELYKKADIAMYEAKKTGKGQYKIYKEN